MAYEIQAMEGGLVLELSQGVTVRDAGELCKRLAASIGGGDTLLVRTRDLEDIDTSILQVLVSLRKTVKGFTIEDPSEVFLSAVDRCALRCELLTN